MLIRKDKSLIFFQAFRYIISLKEIFVSTLTKWDSTLLDFNGESDYVHLIIDDKPDIALTQAL